MRKSRPAVSALLAKAASRFSTAMKTYSPSSISKRRKANRGSRSASSGAECENMPSGSRRRVAVSLSDASCTTTISTNTPNCQTLSEQPTLASSTSVCIQDTDLCAGLRSHITSNSDSLCSSDSSYSSDDAGCAPRDILEKYPRLLGPADARRAEADCLITVIAASVESFETLSASEHSSLYEAYTPPNSPPPCEQTYFDSENVLLSFQRDRRNLVLDSLDPSKTPHIVITPPEACWDELETATQNAVGPQWSGWLMVPIPPPHRTSPACLPPRGPEPPEMTRSLTPAEELQSVPDAPPTPVFNPSMFATWIESTSSERLDYSGLVSALWRHQRKALAYCASTVAPSFRTRYELPDFCDSVERPFQWIDPAEPILANAKYLRGTTVLDSHFPCTVPHIMINEGPPQSPWIGYYNATLSPQDCAHGSRLVVPSAAFVNPPSNFDAYPDPCYSDGELEFEDDASKCESDAASAPDSPLPKTPLSPCADDAVGVFGGDEAGSEGSHAPLERIDGYTAYARSVPGYGFGSPKFTPARFEPILEEDEDEDEDADENGDTNADITPCAVSDSSPAKCVPARYLPSYQVAGDEDEEDELPPFDDWYLGIAARTQAS